MPEEVFTIENQHGERWKPNNFTKAGNIYYSKKNAVDAMNNPKVKWYAGKHKFKLHVQAYELRKI